MEKNDLLKKDSKFGNYVIERKLSRHHDGVREVYLAREENGGMMVLTVFNLKAEAYAQSSAPHAKQPDFIEEVRFLKATGDMEGIPRLLQSGISSYRKHRYGWIAQEYFEGKSLSAELSKERCLTASEAAAVFGLTSRVAEAVWKFTRGEGHYNLSPENILLCYDGNTLTGAAVTGFSNFGRQPEGDVKKWNNWTDGRFRAPETLNGINSARSDVYALGMVTLAMLCGMPGQRVHAGEAEPQKQDALKAGVNTMTPADYNKAIWQAADGALPNSLKMILRKATELSPSDRFASIEKFREFMARYCPKPAVFSRPGDRPAEARQDEHDKTEAATEAESIMEPNPNGDRNRPKGLDEVAGLADLKALFRRDFIRIVRNPQIARAYGIKPSNCTLLYGPQGCGKTFIAEKAAQESGLKYKVVNPAELGSIYVHGSQQKIAETFADAEKKGPMILIFDEFDALVPKRDSELNHNQSNEVNEMLTQMNNCAERGIYLICCTNRPCDLDPAILRKGRVDQTFYVPLPDLEARKELFRMELAKRPCAEDVDIERLGAITDNYTCSDITYIVAEASRQCFEETLDRRLQSPLPLSMEKLTEVSSATVPSVTEAQRKDYLDLRARMENRAGRDSRKKVGFAVKP